MARRCGTAGGGGVVLVELTLPLFGDHPEDAQVRVSSHHGSPGSGNEIDTATASGISEGASSTTKSRNPTTPGVPVITSRARPHFGQATRLAAVTALNRKRQLGQPTWVNFCGAVDIARPPLLPFPVGTSPESEKSGLTERVSTLARPYRTPASFSNVPVRGL